MLFQRTNQPVFTQVSVNQEWDSNGITESKLTPQFQKQEECNDNKSQNLKSSKKRRYSHFIESHQKLDRANFLNEQNEQTASTMTPSSSRENSNNNNMGMGFDSAQLNFNGSPIAIQRPQEPLLKRLKICSPVSWQSQRPVINTLSDHLNNKNDVQITDYNNQNLNEIAELDEEYVQINNQCENFQDFDRSQYTRQQMNTISDVTRIGDINYINSKTKPNYNEINQAQSHQEVSMLDSPQQFQQSHSDMSLNYVDSYENQDWQSQSSQSFDDHIQSEQFEYPNQQIDTHQNSFEFTSNNQHLPKSQQNQQAMSPIFNDFQQFQTTKPNSMLDNMNISQFNQQSQPKSGAIWIR